MKILPFDPADYLDTPEAQEELLADAVESGDAKYLALALGTIARARGMSKVSQEAGVTREALYRAQPDLKRREIMSRKRVDDEYIAHWFRYEPVSAPASKPPSSGRALARSKAARG